MKIKLEVSVGTRKCKVCDSKITKGIGCMNISGGFGMNAYSGNICKECVAKAVGVIEKLEKVIE